MKKIIITIALAGFISLGFTLFENSTTSINEVSSETTIKNNDDFAKSNMQSEKSDRRLASWD
jgi:hypothetical protein